jgi:hypothetical protein
MINPKDNLFSGWFKSRKLMKDQYQILKPTPNDPRPKNIQTESEHKGYLFEQYIVSLFNTDYFTLLEWRSDKSINGIYPLSCKFPDLEFYFTTQYECLHFAVECKWRQHFDNEMADLGREDQLWSYKEFQKTTEIPVFIVLGIGGEPNWPNEIYTIPLREIDGQFMHCMVLRPFQRKSPNDMFFLNCGKLMLS